MKTMKKVLSAILCLTLLAVPISGSFVSAETYDLVVGDANDDKQITVFDALLVLQESLSKGLYTLDPEKVQYGIRYYPELLPYDTDNDGWIQASDALLVLQYAVGKIDSFPRKSAEPSITPVFNTPSEVVLYKDGKAYTITDTQVIENIIDVLNFWFNLYTFPLSLDTHYDNFNDFISGIKADQTAVELKYGTEAVSDASSFSSYNRILIPTTGEYKNTVFLGDNEKYFNTRLYSHYQTDTRFISIVNALSVE